MSLLLGFIHSKMMVLDDDTALIGTANLDFRSLHLNYECMLYINNTKEEVKIKADFEKIFKDSIQVELESWKKRPIYKRLLEEILDMLSPLV